MTRIEGKLRRLSQHSIPREFLFFDTETHIVKRDSKFTDLPLRLGVAIKITLDNDLRPMKRHVHYFRTALEFYDIIEQYRRRNTTIYVFAHNIAFDIIVLDLVSILTEFNYDHKPPIKNGRQFIWKATNDTYRLCFLDTANLGVMSVAMLGDTLRKEKGKVDFDNVDDDTLFEYCLRDVEILEQFVCEYIRFLSIHELGSFKVTIASQAMTAYRTRFMAKDIYIHNHKKALELERNAYHGGRTEAFYIGKLPVENYYYLDVNSMYPFAMIDKPLPVKFRGYTENVPLEYIPHRLRRFYCIMDVTIQTDENFCCVIKDDRLVFPVGVFRTVLHQAELEYLQTCGKILQVHRCAVYEREFIFNQYVDTFYSIKQQSSIDDNQLWRFISKLFLNALYGKFGQKQSHRDELGKTDYDGFIRVPYIDIAKRQNGAEIYWNNQIIREYKSGETSFSCPAIAGAITANSRLLLHRYRKQAGFNNCFYCDTDSLICNQEGYSRLAKFLHLSDLGKLKLENEGTQVIIYGAKDYQFADSTRKKGVPQSAKEIKVGVWEYEQFLGWLSWLNGGMNSGMFTKTTTKKRQTPYSKGIVSNSGIVSPIDLADFPADFLLD